MKSGFVLYTYNGESFSLNTKNLSDGNWHHVEVTWIGTEIKLSIDYDEHFSVIPFTEKIQGLYVGKILIGGPDNTYTSLNAGYEFLEGCIQDVRIGNHQTSLNRPTVRENVMDGCPDHSECQQNCPASAECVVGWGTSKCDCQSGYVGESCMPVCSMEPCENMGTCISDLSSSKGYQCQCNSTDYSGKNADFFMARIRS